MLLLQRIRQTINWMWHTCCRYSSRVSWCGTAFWWEEISAAWWGGKTTFCHPAQWRILASVWQSTSQRINCTSWHARYNARACCDHWINRAVQLQLDYYFSVCVLHYIVYLPSFSNQHLHWATSALNLKLPHWLIALISSQPAHLCSLFSYHIPASVLLQHPLSVPRVHTTFSSHGYASASDSAFYNSCSKSHRKERPKRKTLRRLRKTDIEGCFSLGTLDIFQCFNVVVWAMGRLFSL